MHCCISKQGSIIIPKRALEMQSKAFFSHIGGSLNNIGLLRPPFAFFCKHWVEVKLLLFGNIVNVTMTIRPWFSIVTYEFYFTICYRNVFSACTLVHRYTVWGISNSSGIRNFTIMLPSWTFSLTYFCSWILKMCPFFNYHP